MKLISFLLLFVFIYEAAAKRPKIRLTPGKPLIKTSFAYPNENGTLKDFLIEDIGFTEEQLAQDGLYERIKSYNPNLDENLLSKGQEIYLEYPSNITLPTIRLPEKKKVEEIEPEEVEQLAEEKPPEQPIKKPVEQPPVKKPEIKVAAAQRKVYQKQVADFPETKDSKAKTFRLSAFYMMSMGTFSETLSSGANLSTDQNSPISFGLAYGKKLRPDSSVSGSVYFSTLTGAGTNVPGVGQQSVDIPPEIGTNFYYNKVMKKFVHSAYAGLDFERFSTFNTDELNLGQNLSTREHSVFYLTAGVNHLFTFIGMRNLLKFSLSKSIMTSSSRDSIASDKQFTGWRFTFYYNVSPGGRFFYHLLFKRHQMSGPTELVINRIGAGLGYTIF